MHRYATIFQPRGTPVFRQIVTLQPTPKKNHNAILVALFFIAVAAGAAILQSVTQWNVPAVAKTMRNPVPATESTIDAGMFAYSKHCKSCHGEDGDGKGDRAAELSVKPTDFTNAAEISKLADGELFWKITHGHRPMPGFQDKLTDMERWQLVNYVRTFARNESASPTR